MNDTDMAEDERGLLETLLIEGFDGNTAELALVLGRTPDEIGNILDGSEPVDDDLAMKVRGIAQERGISIE